MYNNVKMTHTELIEHHLSVFKQLSQCVAIVTCRYSNSFRPYRQGDAHEVMRCILDAVRMEEIEVCHYGIDEHPLLCNYLT